MASVNIRESLMALADEKYRNFSSALIPNIDKERVIGVRMPELRALVREFRGSAEAAAFLSDLPHYYHEENILHGLLISEMRNVDECIAALDVFLTYADNWAVTDSTSPRIFSRNKSALLSAIHRWISSPHPYAVRFAILMLMKHFLGDDFSSEYPRMVAEVVLDEYYVQMMQAWYFATALVTNYDEVLPYISEHRLAPFVHRKTIGKARESYRFPREVKEYLLTLK